MNSVYCRCIVTESADIRLSVLYTVIQL